jgi:vacuolar-type H+-ATPase subunit E/Vma4
MQQIHVRGSAGTFTLTFNADAEKQIRRCIALVDRLDPRKEKQLIDALEHALKELAKDKRDRLRKADRKLEEFIRKVQEALMKRHLTPDQAAQLIACATQAQSALGCP